MIPLSVKRRYVRRVLIYEQSPHRELAAIHLGENQPEILELEFDRDHQPTGYINLWLRIFVSGDNVKWPNKPWSEKRIEKMLKLGRRHRLNVYLEYLPDDPDGEPWAELFRHAEMDDDRDEIEDDHLLLYMSEVEDDVHFLAPENYDEEGLFNPYPLRYSPTDMRYREATDFWDEDGLPLEDVLLPDGTPAFAQAREK